ncbi:MAG: protoporphyrinogen oxidase [Planctomycetes bacterium]|nr:protoporphyrinogen oxidase [Planctomycetota bacterium]NBY03566.1 protoporphyrinogen oxidase [Planctomycetota bacterium]
MPRVAIIGGGISGLTLAYRLRQYLADADVQILESENSVGGKIASFKDQGFLYESGPNGFLDSNPSTYNLSKELGLSGQLTPANDAAAKNRFLLMGGKLRLLPSSLLGLLTTDILSWRAKLSLAFERFKGKKSNLSDESIYAFAQRRVGTEIADKLVDPFVTGIFAGDARFVSYQAGFPRLAAMEKNYGSISKGLKAARKARLNTNPEGGRSSGQLWSFNQGLGTLTDALAEKCGKSNIKQFRVINLIQNNAENKWIIEGSNGESESFDIAILACPAFSQAAILKNLDEILADKIASIPYNSLAVVVMGFRSGDVPIPLEGFGYLTPSSENRAILGVQWCSSIYRGRAPAGTVLLRAMCGGASRPEMVDLDDDSIAKIVYRELQASMEIQAPPCFLKVVRWKNAIPQYMVNHLEKVKEIEASLANHPGLYLTGNAYKGISINDCVENAENLAVQISRWWSRAKETKS